MRVAVAFITGACLYAAFNEIGLILALFVFSIADSIQINALQKQVDTLVELQADSVKYRTDLEKKFDKLSDKIKSDELLRR